MKLNCFIRTGMYIIMSGEARDKQTVTVNGIVNYCCVLVDHSKQSSIIRDPVSSTYSWQSFFGRDLLQP